MKAFLKKVYRRLKKLNDWRRTVWNAPNDFRIPFITKVRYALRTFSPNEYVWYDLAKNDYHEYISDYERICSREIDGVYKVILDSKLLFEEIFRNYTRVPITYAWVSDGIVYGMHGYKVHNSNIAAFIQKHSIVVLKAEDGCEGKGTYVIEANSNGAEYPFFVNGRLMSKKDVEALFSQSGQAILSEYIHQSDFGNYLYPHSTNTIRVVCAKKKGEQKAHIIKAVQRIGNEASRPVDNVSAGAIACEIDLETGRLGMGRIPKSHQDDRARRFFSTHPDTGCVLEGLALPGWEQLKKDIVDLTNQFPYLNFIAWDVLPTNDGFCIIEANASSSMILQIERGVRNGETGDIYRSYGIIK